MTKMKLQLNRDLPKVDTHALARRVSEAWSKVPRAERAEQSTFDGAPLWIFELALHEIRRRNGAVRNVVMEANLAAAAKREPSG